MKEGCLQGMMGEQPNCQLFLLLFFTHMDRGFIICRMRTGRVCLALLLLCFSTATIMKPSDCASWHTFHCAFQGACHDNTKVSSCNWPGCNSLRSLTSVRPRMNVPVFANSVGQWSSDNCCN